MEILEKLYILGAYDVLDYTGPLLNLYPNAKIQISFENTTKST